MAQPETRTDGNQRTVDALTAHFAPESMAARHCSHDWPRSHIADERPDASAVPSRARRAGITGTESRVVTLSSVMHHCASPAITPLSTYGKEAATTSGNYKDSKLFMLLLALALQQRERQARTAAVNGLGAFSCMPRRTRRCTSSALR